MPYVISNGNLIDSDELMHYGVPGMKWGVRRAERKASQSSRLERKAAKLDKKSAKLYGKSEKLHSKIDLTQANKAAAKSSKYAVKAAKLEKKALGQTNEYKRAKTEAKAAKNSYKSMKYRTKANRLSLSKGYGIRALRTRAKSDAVAAKAAKARMKIAQNKRYNEALKRKVSTIPQEKLATAKSYVDRLSKLD